MKIINHFSGAFCSAGLLCDSRCSLGTDHGNSSSSARLYATLSFVSRTLHLYYPVNFHSHCYWKEGSISAFLSTQTVHMINIALTPWLDSSASSSLFSSRTTTDRFHYHRYSSTPSSPDVTTVTALLSYSASAGSSSRSFSSRT